MTRQNTCESVAPSTFAASINSVGTALIAAERMTIENPVWIQMKITISNTLLNGGSWTKKTVSPDVADGVEGVSADATADDAEVPDEEPTDEQRHDAREGGTAPAVAGEHPGCRGEQREQDRADEPPNTIDGDREAGRQFPSPTQIPLITPVCSVDESRATYMNRQITDAPTSEIAIGMKMIDLATRSNRTPSARTAMARPSAVEVKVTTTTHQRLLISVPRRTVKTAKQHEEEPKTSGRMLGLPNSTVRPVRRFWRVPM